MPKYPAFELTIFMAYQGPQNSVMKFLLCFMFEIELRNDKIGMANLSKNNFFCFIKPDILTDGVNFVQIHWDEYCS